MGYWFKQDGSCDYGSKRMIQEIIVNVVMVYAGLFTSREHYS